MPPFSRSCPGNGDHPVLGIKDEEMCVVGVWFWGSLVQGLLGGCDTTAGEAVPRVD